LPFDRRAFLKAFAGAGALAAAGARAEVNPTVNPRPRFSADPFSLGVASGYPLPGGMVLWTRLAPAPAEDDGGMGHEIVPVRWELATDEAMREVVASGSAEAAPEWGHSVHVEPQGLAPDRPYWYRFSAGAAQSPIGRTRTAPAVDAAPARLRFAFASCQQYEQGYYGAYKHIVADAPDLIVFLGDYIYESSWGRNHVRKHTGGEPYTLEDYRVRYALYKSDADLQAAHRACPWIVTWDDHEVDNDYADDLSEDGMPRERFLARRAAAYRAYYEHMPLPARMRPQGGQMKIYTRVDWGRLASVHLLDDRQYRSHEACSKRPGGGGSNVVDAAECAALADPARSMLGAGQEAWLDAALERTRSGWNVIAQQTLMAQLDRQTGTGKRVWTDGWDGYPAARRRLLDSVAARRPANPVVIGGDVHAHWVADLKSDFDDPHAPVVASEFCGTSITSQGPSQKFVEAALAENPHLKYGRGDKRGYVRVEVKAKQLSVDLRAMESVQTADAACSTLVSYVVEDGRPGPQRA
jgi:alkaline phosphatase D